MHLNNDYLLQKIDTGCPSPRYTSYPPHPKWNQNLTVDHWYDSVSQDIETYGYWGLYVHLPFCERLCKFCGCPRIISRQKTPMTTYLKLLKKEWDVYRERLNFPPSSLRKCQVGGGTPTYFSPQELEIIFGWFENYFQFDYSDFYAFEAHPQSTTYDHLKLLFDMGFGRVSFGIQDFDERVQEVIGRIEPFEDVARVVHMARQVGYRSINFDLIYGLPEQTPESFQRTLELSVSLEPDRIALFSYAHVPWLHPHQNAMGRIPKGLEKWSLYMQGHEFLLKKGYKTAGFDHYVKPQDTLAKAYQEGTIDRNFNGMVDFSPPSQIGIGLFAIGHSSAGYVQNHRHLVHYQQSLDGQRPRFSWSHAWDAVEKQIREKINRVLIYGDFNLFELDSKDQEELLKLGVCEQVDHHRWMIKSWAQPFRRLVALYLDPLRLSYTSRSFSEII